MAAPFVLVLPDGTAAGYYTLWSTSVQLGDLPEQTARKLPRYPLVPATLLGRLAVDRRQQGKGCGRFLLADALYRAARSEIASFALIVDAKDDNARRFHERESFLPFPDQPMKLFRPKADIFPTSHPEHRALRILPGRSPQRADLSLACPNGQGVNGCPNAPQTTIG
jgi:hypothetical protein